MTMLKEEGIGGPGKELPQWQKELKKCAPFQMDKLFLYISMLPDNTIQIYLVAFICY